MARFAEMNRFQPGFSTNDHSVNDLDHLSVREFDGYFLHLCSWIGYFTSTSYLKGGTLVFRRILCSDESTASLSNLAEMGFEKVYVQVYTFSLHVLAVKC